MQTIDATTVKNRFGETIDRARIEPVHVSRSGRVVAVIVSSEEYARLQALDDAYWSQRAREAEQSGYLGTEASAAFVREALESRAD